MIFQISPKLSVARDLSQTYRQTVARGKSWAKHKTPFELHSNRRLTKVQHSNTESLKQATPEHVVSHVIAALQRRRLTHVATALKSH